MKTRGGGEEGDWKSTKEGMAYPVQISACTDPIKKSGLLSWRF